MKSEYFAEQINDKLVSISHHGMAVQVQLVETGQIITNVLDVMVWYAGHHDDDAHAQVKLHHWYEPEQRYHFEIASCKATFA